MEQVRRADEARLEVAAGGDKGVELRCRLGNVGADTEVRRQHAGGLGLILGADFAADHIFPAERLDRALPVCLVFLGVSAAKLDGFDK